MTYTLTLVKLDLYQGQKGLNMTNLQTYVKDTIDEVLTHYDGKIEHVVTDAMQGTSTGWWNDLIYTADILSLFPGFKKGLVKALAEYADATNESVLDTVHIHHDFTAEDVMLALVSTQQEIKENETLTRAACWLVSFGVEWETNQYPNNLEYENRT